MIGTHLDPGDLRRLFAGAATGPGREALAHLLLCARCRVQAVRLSSLELDPDCDDLLDLDELDLDETRSDPPHPSDPPDSIHPVERQTTRLAIEALRGSLAAALADRENAAALYREILARPRAARLAALAGEEAFLSPALARRFLDRAEAVCAEGPGEADHLASLALVIAGRLPQPWTMLERESLLGRSRCIEGEARRVQGDMPGARLAQRRAFRHLEVLPVGCPERADFCRYLSRLRRDQGRDDEAHALLARAIERYDALPDARRAAECRLELAWMHLDDLDAEEALPLFEESLLAWEDEALEIEGRARGRVFGAAGEGRSGDEPFRRWLSIRHGLALAYADLRREGEARAVLAQVGAVGRERSRLDRLRIVRVEADVEQRLDANAEAEALLERAWVELRDEGEPFEAVLALLDLAQLYAEQLRAEDIETLKEGLATIVGPSAASREALEFGLDFTVQHGVAGIEILEALKTFLRRARHSPDARFSIVRQHDFEVLWERADEDLRIKLAVWAGLETSAASLAAQELEPAHRHRLAWTAEAVVAIRLLFHEPDEPGDGERAEAVN